MCSSRTSQRNTELGTELDPHPESCVSIPFILTRYPLRNTAPTTELEPIQNLVQGFDIFILVIAHLGERDYMLPLKK